mmetsp:Transcript_24413/g.43320  ORF Transcript_24413/g.43320 Transcript_24413/m.43320 type:complete len:256 (-) Transcript_24413:399-1166(-)
MNGLAFFQVQKLVDRDIRFGIVLFSLRQNDLDSFSVFKESTAQFERVEMRIGAFLHLGGVHDLLGAISDEELEVSYGLGFESRTNQSETQSASFQNAPSLLFILHFVRVFSALPSLPRFLFLDLRLLFDATFLLLICSFVRLHRRNPPVFLVFALQSTSLTNCLFLGLVGGFICCHGARSPILFVFALDGSLFSQGLLFGLVGSDDGGLDALSPIKRILTLQSLSLANGLFLRFVGRSDGLLGAISPVLIAFTFR